MALPKSTKGFLKLLIDIAENGDLIRLHDSKLTVKENHEIGSIIAGIQNDLSESTELLEKYKLEYNG